MAVYDREAKLSHPLLLVWVDAWQMQCCGPSFTVGSRVEWTLYEQPEPTWLASMVGADLAGEVTHGEEHHGGLDDGAPTTAGDVQRIRAVSGRFGPDPDNVSAARPVHISIPGTGRVTEVGRADGWYPETEGLGFYGYLVDLRRAEG